jgi:hypothetical protein
MLSRLSYCRRPSGPTHYLYRSRGTTRTATPSTYYRNSSLSVSSSSSSWCNNNSWIESNDRTTNHTAHQLYFRRSFHASAIGYDDEATATAAAAAAAAADEKAAAEKQASAAQKAAAAAQKAVWRAAALDYNNRRAAYNRSVRQVRKLYASQIAEENETARLAKESAQQTLTRQRLERQRLKNEKSAVNALRLEQFRQDRERDFETHLDDQQIVRDATHERFRAARQVLIDDVLEPEAPLWLTTVDEIHTAFSHENTQLLWGRPGGVIGAPNPTLDARFWEYQSHTWHMTKTYKSPKQILLEDLEHEAYLEANIDPNVWTFNRQAEWENQRRRSKLRALIHAAGRSALIRRQQRLLEDQYETALQQADQLPQPRPVPSLELLRDDVAIEQEGMKLALATPSDFFQFDQSMASGRGVPVDLVDPLRKEHPNVFPLVVGRDPPPDTRTEKEKKLELRELEKKWAVAAAVTDAADDDDDDDDDANDPDTLDYESFVGLTDDEDYNAGRYSADEIEWVSEQLAAKLHHYQQEFAQDLDSARQDLKSEITAVPMMIPTTTTTTTTAAGTADDNTNDNNDNKIRDASLESALLKLSDDELIQLSDFDDLYRSGRLSEAQAVAAMAEIRFLSPAHLRQLVSRDRTVDLEEDQ